MNRNLLPFLVGLVAVACGPADETPKAEDASSASDDGSSDDGGTDGDDGTGPCDAGADRDGDGLDDCTEEDLGTDAGLADTDGDGISDGDELDCVSDPLDADEQCYACGWEHNDPGTLAATGAEVGDTIDNLLLVDQCGDEVALWDFAGAYTIAFVTAAWCPQCKDEAGDLGASAASLATETGLPVQGLIVLFEGRTADDPVPEEAAQYAAELGAETTPVLADVNVAALAALPYDGRELPGVCLLGPALEILGCGTGPGQIPAFAATIADHAR